MKRTLLSVCLMLSCLFSCAVAASDKGVARPDLVREVVDGKRQEAKVSWWGFDANDSTEFLQKAINSGVRKLIVDRQSSPWVTRPLTGVSNQEIVFESGTQLVALKGAFHGESDCLLTFDQCRNITIRGAKQDGGKAAQILMHKDDYQSAAYSKSEWRHGISLSGCRNVLIQDLRIAKTGGDGIYLGASWSAGASKDVVIRRVDCDDNHRQGISVISAENLLIENCRLRNTKGTDPQAGIDFEPNSPTDVLLNCVLRKCVAEGNGGTGYQICPQMMSSKSKPISITLEDCVSRGNTFHAVHLCSAPKDQPTGLLRIKRLISENDALAGLAVQFNPSNGIRIEMQNSTIRDAARADSFFAPIYIQGVDDKRPIGNIHFDHVTIKDDLDRPFIRIRGAKGNEVQDITGQITLDRNGRKQNIEISDSWLQMHPWPDKS